MTQRLENIEPLRLRWVETADADVGRELAERYEDSKAVLNVHLCREVTEVMPVVDRVLTEKEMFKEIPARSDSATASWAAGCTGNSTRHSSRDARFPKHSSLLGRPDRCPDRGQRQSRPGMP